MNYKLRVGSKFQAPVQTFTRNFILNLESVITVLNKIAGIIHGLLTAVSRFPFVSLERFTILI